MNHLDRVARAIYDSHQFVRPWDHPKTQEIWREACRRTARSVLKEIEKITIERLAEQNKGEKKCTERSK